MNPVSSQLLSQLMCPPLLLRSPITTGSHEEVWLYFLVVAFFYVVSVSREMCFAPEGSMQKIVYMDSQLIQ